MVAASVPRIHSWGNRHYSALSGALRSSPSQGRDLRVPFLFGRRVAAIEDQIVQQGVLLPSRVSTK